MNTLAGSYAAHRTLHAARAVALLAACLLASSCTRDFAAPEPAPVIEAFSERDANLAGFAGDWVLVRGAHFAASPQDNQVQFATVPATVIEASESALLVEVPLLPEPQEVYLTVTTASGMGTSPSTFSWLGPGHPRAEEVDEHIQLDWGPVAVAPMEIPATENPTLAVASNAGRIASLLGYDGFHLDFGTIHPPMSVAVLPGEQGGRLFATTLEADASADDLLVARLWTLEVTGTDLLPEVDRGWLGPSGELGLDGPPRPAMLWPYCAQAAGEGCTEAGLAASALSEPHLLVIDTADDEIDRVVRIDRAGCERPEPAGPVADLVWDRTAQRFLVVLEESPEVWSVPPDGTCPQRLWPAPDETDPDILGRRLTTVALRRESGAEQPLVYVTDASFDQLIELGFDPQQGAYRITRSAATWNAPYASVVARAESGAPLLFVATGTGLLVYDTDRGAGDLVPPLVAVDALFMDPCSGGVQSLAGIRYTGPDQEDNLHVSGTDDVVFTDTLRNRLLLFQPGRGLDAAIVYPMGMLAPYVAASSFSDTLYLSDFGANVIRLVDRSSGLQSKQLAIQDESSFGLLDLACLDGKGADVLLAPMPGAGQQEDGNQMTFDHLVIRFIPDRDELERQALEGYGQQEAGVVDSVAVATEGGKGFHEMLPAPRSGHLYLVTYGGGTRPGSVSLLPFRPDAEGADEFMEVDRPGPGEPGDHLTIDLLPTETLVRLSPAENALLALDRPEGGSPRLRVVPVADPQASFHIGLDHAVASLVCDVALVTAPVHDTDDGLVEPPSASVLYAYLALAELGVVAAVDAEGGIGFIQTAGAPSLLAPSPDGRRLYVLHRDGGRLTVIDTDHRDGPDFNRVVANPVIPTDARALSFHQSGNEAFVTYWMRNTITVIE